MCQVWSIVRKRTNKTLNSTQRDKGFSHGAFLPFVLKPVDMIPIIPSTGLGEFKRK